MVNETSEAHFLASVAHAFSLTVVTPWHNNAFLFPPLAPAIPLLGPQSPLKLEAMYALAVVLSYALANYSYLYLCAD